jgi:hypothetical protein
MGKECQENRILIYEQQDYDKAISVIGKKILMDINKRTLELIESDIQEVATLYYSIRIKHFQQAWDK